MALINKAKREINAKIVYYGREGNGKSLSLRYIYDRLKPSLRGEFKTMQTMGDSLQFFDFTPFEMPMFGGYRIRFHVYTLTGAVGNPAAWKMTLKGSDGVVLVANAAPAALTDEQASFACLRDYVGSYGISLHDVPLVAQFGRGSESEHCAPEDLCMALGVPGVPSVLAQPASGEGVLEALSQLSQLVMTRIGQDQALTEPIEQPEPSAVSGLTEALQQSGQADETDLHLSAAKSDVSVAIAGDVSTSRNGSVTLPLQITVAGEQRRFVLTVSLQEQ